MNDYQEILDNITGYIIKLNKSNEIIYYNKLAKEVFFSNNTACNNNEKVNFFTLFENLSQEPNKLQFKFKNQKKDNIIFKSLFIACNKLHNIKWNCNKVFNDNGTIESIICTGFDIPFFSISKEEEQSSLEDEVCIAFTNKNGEIVELNDNAMNVLKNSPSFSNISEFNFKSNDINKDEDKTRQSSTEIVHPMEYVKNDGSKGIIDLLIVPDDKRVNYNKRYEISNYLWKFIFNKCSDMIFIKDLSKPYFEMNDIACEKLGYNKDEVFELKPEDIDINASSKEYMEKIIEDCRTKGHCLLKSKYLTKSGGTIDVEMNIHLFDMDDTKIYFAVVRDLSNRLELEKSEQKWKNFFSKSKDLIFIHKFDSHGFEVNDIAVNKLGYSRLEFEKLKLKDIDLRWQEKEYRDYIVNKLKTEGDVLFETYLTSKNNGLIPVEINSHFIDAEGEKTLLSIARDLSERKKIENALFHIENKFQAVVENIKDGLIISDTDTGKILFANSVIYNKLEYSEKDFYSKKFNNIIKSINLKNSNVNDKIKNENFNELEVKLLTKNGANIYAILSSQIIELEGKEVLLSLIKDITKRYEIEKTLRNRVEHYKEIFNNINDAIFVNFFDDKGRYSKFIDVNQTACKLLGYTRDELLNLEPYDISDEKVIYNDEQIDFVNEVKNDVNFVIERTICTKNKEILPVEIKGHWFRFFDKNISIAVIRDLSRKNKYEAEIEKSEKKYKAIVEDQSELICRCKVNGELTFVNDAYCKYFDEKKENLIGFNFIEFMPDEDKKIAYETLKSITVNNPSTKSEHKVKLKNGEIRWQEWVDRGIFDNENNLIEIQSVGRDITERVLAKKERERLIKELEKTNKELLELSNLKDSFLSIASHDLRSPFMCIRTLVEIILKEADLSKKHVKYLKMIKQSTDNQLEYINNILDVIKIEAGKIKLDYSEVKIGDFIKNCFKDFLILAEKKNITITTEIKTNKTLTIDKAKINQVLNNLLSNAIKFTRLNGFIKITCFLKDKSVEIHIIDNGIGIPEDKVDLIFSPYTQYHSEGTEGEPGSGLGLSICKNFVELHGGGLKVKSTENKGSDFYFTLPVK